jgi:hypothetical protein
MNTVFIHAGGLLFGNKRTERYYDLTGSLTFFSIMIAAVVAALQSFGALSLRQLTLAGCVMVWCTRYVWISALPIHRI